MKKAEKKLKKIIKRMRQIQKSIAADPQPVSILQLEELSQLGGQYAQIVEELRSADK